MAQKHISRQQQYALDEAREHHYHGGSDRAWQQQTKRYGKNVLAPLDEEREVARRTPRDISVHNVTGQSQHLLIENIILLLFLAGAIYALYHLTIYLLNQA